MEDIYLYLITALISFAPILELRAAIPYGIINELNPISVITIAIMSNILVFPLVYFFMNFIHKFLIKIKIYKQLYDKFVIKTRNKINQKFKKYEYLGLTLFVGIPLPVTGAYTASLGAWLLGLKQKQSFIAISIGVIMAGIIITTLTLLGKSFF